MSKSFIKSKARHMGFIVILLKILNWEVEVQEGWVCRHPRRRSRETRHKGGRGSGWLLTMEDLCTGETAARYTRPEEALEREDGDRPIGFTTAYWSSPVPAT